MEKRLVRMGTLAGIGIVLGVVCAQAAFADEHKVPSQYATIQAAINAASDGDTVLVADGTFTGTDNKNLTWSGKYLTVESEHGATKSIIDCQNSGRAFKLSSQTGNGKFFQPDFEGDQIRGFTLKNGQTSSGDPNGGAIYLYNSRPLIEGCVLTDNRANVFGGDGGGIYGYGSNAYIWDCIIKNNTADQYGGGISCEYCSPSIGNCSIKENDSGSMGGGICNEYAYPAIFNSSISKNSSMCGGGIAYEGSQAGATYYYIDNCMIFDNIAGSGGGVFYNSSFVGGNSIWRSTIMKNVASGSGAGIYLKSASAAAFVDCVITDNKVDGCEGNLGGGVCVIDHSEVCLRYCTLASNSVSGSPGGGGGISMSHFCEATIENTLFNKNYYGSINTWQLEENCKIYESANCLEPFSWSVDENSEIYWDSNNVFNTDPKFVCASRGNYRLQEDSCCKNNGISISGINYDRDMNSRSYGTAPDIGAYEWPNPAKTIGVPVTNMFTHDFGTIQRAMDAAVDGDTVTVIDASILNGEPPTSSFDGTYRGPENKDLTWTYYNGKNITIESLSGKPENCVIDCEGSGRGFNFQNGETTDTVVKGFTIKNGNGVDEGAGICLYSGSPCIMNCIIDKCENDGSGGGIFCGQNTSPIIKNCLITNCKTKAAGGAIHNNFATLSLTNCTIASNAAEYYDQGDGICSTGGSVTVKNCILWDNGEEIRDHSGAAITVTYSDVEDGWSGTGNINSDPKFVGAYRLAADSPCIDVATATGAPTTDIEGNGRYDYPGWPGTGQVSTVDMGAYEAVPPLVWSTFLGGSSDDYGYAVAVDSAGCVYVTGQAGGSSFPTQSGYDETFDGSADSFVTKFKADGTGIIYSTFIGGSGGENSYNILVNGSGEAYVAGNTNSSNFPTTTGAYDRSYYQCSDVVVFKLNSSGNELLFSTYLGGNVDEAAYGLALDSSGNVYVAGITDSTNFPVTTGSYRGDYDAYVCKFDDDCSSLQYAMYIGGNFTERALQLAVDSAGCAYAIGETQSSNFPATSGAFDQSHNGNYDAFITKLDSDGDSLVYSSFLGGSSDDSGRGILLDSSGCVYMVGYMGSASTGLATSGAYQETKGSSFDAFVAKLDAGGSSLEFFTYLGGGGSDSSICITRDTSGKILLTGQTESSDFPVTAGTYQCAYGGNSDVFVARLNSDCSALEYSTYLGGSGSEYAGKKIELDSLGQACVTGYTESNDFPVTSGAYDETQNGGKDVFVTKLSLVAAPPIYSVTVSSSPSNGGSVSRNPDRELYTYGEQVTLTASPASGYDFSYWDGDASGSQNPKTITVTGDMSVTAYFIQGGYTLTTSVSPSGSGSVSKNPDKATYNSNDVVTLTASRGSGYTFSYWSGDLGGNQNPKNITMTGNSSVTANFSWGGGCW